MFPVADHLLATWDPYVLACTRLGLAAVVLVTALALREGRWLVIAALPWRDIWLLGGAGLAVGTTLLALGIKHSGATAAAIISASSPIVAAFVARVLFAIAIPRAVLAGAVLAVGGGVLAALAGRRAGGLGGGEVLVLLSLTFWLCYSQSAQRRLGALSQLAITALTVLAGAVTLAAALPILIALGIAEARLDLAPPSLALVVYIAVGPASLSIFLWHFGVSRMGVTVASIWGNLVPVIVVLITLAGGASLQALHLVGGVLIVAGALTAQLARTRLGVGRFYNRPPADPTPKR